MSDFDSNRHPQKKLVSRGESSGVLCPSANMTTEETPLEVFTEVVENALEVVEDNSTNRWMDIAAPIMKSGGKTVAVILSLGFISIPLMISGSPWVALVLAIGASVTAICSSFR